MQQRNWVTTTATITFVGLPDGAVIGTYTDSIIGRMILIIRATQNSTKTCFFYNSTLIVHSFGLGIIKLQNKSAVYL